MKRPARLTYSVDDNDIRFEVTVEHKGEYVGSIVAYRRTVENEPLTAELYADIQPEWQGKGIGRALLKKAVRYATNTGIIRLEARVLGEPWLTPTLIEHGFKRSGGNTVAAATADVLRALERRVSDLA